MPNFRGRQSTDHAHCNAAGAVGLRPPRYGVDAAGVFTDAMRSLPRPGMPSADDCGRRIGRLMSYGRRIADGPTQHDDALAVSRRACSAATA
jgi:hypothetical protein